MSPPRVVRIGLGLGWFAVAGIPVIPICTYRGKTVAETAIGITAAIALSGVVVNAIALHVEPGWWRRSTAGILLSLVPALAALALFAVLANSVSFNP